MYFQARREYEFKHIPKWQKYWKLMKKKENKISSEEKERLEWEKKFLHRLILKFLDVLESIPEEGNVLNNLLYFQYLCVIFLHIG